MKQFSAPVIANRPVCDGFYELSFAWEQSAPQPAPGQFFTVRTSDTTVPLLRRPFAFSAFDPDGGKASMIYQKRGMGTGLLTALEKGDRLDVIGPLGKPFPLLQSGHKALLVAGGIGIGPVLFLGAALAAANTRQTLIFGCRSQANVPAVPVFESLGAHLCTDDGSRGFKGTVVDYLRSAAVTVDTDTVLYACGPHPMLKGCHEFAREQNIRCLVSVEQIMACGVGACMGCVVKVNRESGYARACVDGPVFSSSDINWE